MNSSDGMSEEMKLRLMGIETVIASLLKYSPEAQVELTKIALALDAPSVAVPDHYGPTLARAIRAYVQGRPGVRPED